MSTAPRILGIDPGLNITGYAVIEVASGGPLICEAGVIRGRSHGTLTERLAELYSGISEVLTSFKPSVVALEQLYSHYQRPRTAILMGHARGVLCLAATHASVPVKSYSATQIKKILTGAGRAPKQQMQEAIQREFHLPTLPEPPDVADALAIALCHYYLQPELVQLGKRRA